MIDVHTHLVGGQLSASGLHDVMLYHMVISDLYAAGCPSGARLTQYPGWPSREEARSRIEEAIPFLPHIHNSSSYWGVKKILEDLYDWTEDITLRNWQELDDLIRERAEDRGWSHGVLDSPWHRAHGHGDRASRGGARRRPPAICPRMGLLHALPVGRIRYGPVRAGTVLGAIPESPSPIGTGGRAIVEHPIRTLVDIHDAIAHYVREIPDERVLSTATHISTDIRFRDVADSEMEAALGRRGLAGPIERDIYASYIQEAFLSALESSKPGVVYQFSLGAEPLPFETASRLSQETIASLAAMIGRHPALRFQCFLASRHANQSLCTLARELPNLSLAGYWWHNFFPSVIAQVMEERLDMLPANKQVGFFSDAYCVEWTYAKLKIVRAILARVLAAKVEIGQILAWRCHQRRPRHAVREPAESPRFSSSIEGGVPPCRSFAAWSSW